MSSWLQNTSLPPLSNDKLFCKITTSGYGSNFFNFFMCYLFAQHKKKKLYLNDTGSNLSKEYHFILDTLKALPNIEYTLRKGLTIQQMFPKELNGFYNSLPKEIILQEASRIFQFKDTIQEKTRIFQKGLPSFDCGVHVRTGDKITTGEMKEIPLLRYLDAIKEYQTVSGKHTAFHLYIMTDSNTVLDYFKANKDPSWSIYTVPSPNRFQQGHDQSTYNKQSSEVRFQCFYHFLAELEILQECPHIVCTFSSNIGRYLDLRKKGTIVSLD